MSPQPAGVLLDSSVLINLLHHRKEPVRLVRELALAGVQLGVSSINVAEIYAGMRKEEEKETAELFSAFTCFPVTDEIARTAGKIVASRRRSGRTYALLDMLIAATAICYGYVLFTDNRKDFDVPGVVLFPPA